MCRINSSKLPPVLCKTYVYFLQSFDISHVKSHFTVKNSVLSPAAYFILGITHSVDLSTRVNVKIQSQEREMRNIALSSASMPWLELTFNYRTELVHLIIQPLIRSPIERTGGKFIWERKRKEDKSWKSEAFWSRHTWGV